ncbi:CDP-archaeol synthase [Roseicella aquatilis]|uniref:CDP-archaeol synthase n=1 Tax=Roseicella aquatilis TaxID=2527868 RepID=A0A4R4D2K5_9PROT|nr:CDP-archaeol synthase [Roseicella aquatilis]
MTRALLPSTRPGAPARARFRPSCDPRPERLRLRAALGAAGGLAGLGPLTGDLVKSAAKRQMGIAPGRPWTPFDQVAWLVGALAFGWMALDLPSGLFISVLVVGVVSHLLVNAVSHLLRLRRAAPAGPAGRGAAPRRWLAWACSSRARHRPGRHGAPGGWRGRRGTATIGSGRRATDRGMLAPWGPAPRRLSIRRRSPRARRARSPCTCATCRARSGASSRPPGPG